MLTDGKFVCLSIGTDLYNHKPTFLFWLEVPGQLLFGLNNFGTKIFPVLFSFLGVWGLGQFVKLHYNKTVGQLTQLIYATSFGFLFYNNDVHTDLVLTTLIILAVWKLSAYLKSNRKIELVLASLFLGGAVLTKGPIGFIIPFLGVGVHLMIRKNWKQIFNANWLLVLGMVGALLIPYTLALYNDFGNEGLIFFYVENTIGRMTNYVERRVDPFYYFHSTLGFFIPWSIPGIMALISRMKKQNWSTSEDYSLGIMVLLFLILTISSNKSPNYLLPIIPFLSVITANYLHQLSEKSSLRKLKQIHRTMQITGLFVLGVLMLATFLLPSPNREVYIFTLMVFAIMSTWILYSRKEILQGISRLGILASLVLFAGMNAHIFPSIINENGAIKAARIYNENAGKNAQLNNYIYGQYEHYFYARGKTRNEPDLHNFIYYPPKNEQWVLLPESYWHDVERIGVPVINKYEIDHLNVLRKTFLYLNPNTRQSSLDKLLLLELDVEKLNQ